VVVRHQRIFIESCGSAVCSTVYIVAGLERDDGCSQRGTLRDSLWVQSFPPSQEEQGGQVYQELKWCGQGPSWEGRMVVKLKGTKSRAGSLQIKKLKQLMYSGNHFGPWEGFGGRSIFIHWLWQCLSWVSQWQVLHNGSFFTQMSSETLGF
jgi:hypothetical protein